MSDRIKRDWRERVTEITKRKPTVRKPRRRLGEKLMITATVLSACATAFTGYIAVMQYGAMERAIIAPNKNQSFQELLKAMNDACIAATPARSWLLLSLAGVTKQPLHQEDLKVLSEPADKLEYAFDAFMIWVDYKDREYLQEINTAFLNPFRMLNFIGVVDLLGKDRWREDNISRIGLICTGGQRRMIEWFHEGKKFDLTEYLEAKAPDSIEQQQ